MWWICNYVCVCRPVRPSARASGWCCVEGSVRDGCMYVCRPIRPSAPAGMLQWVGAGEENGRAMLEPRNPNPCATLIGQKAGPLPPPLPHTPTLYTNLGPEHARGGRAGGMIQRGCGRGDARVGCRPTACHDESPSPPSQSHHLTVPTHDSAQAGAVSRDR